MRGRKLVVASLGILLVAAVVGGVWYYNYRQSPAYALGQLREAVEEQNTLKFERYAQIDHFAEAFVDDVFSVTTQQAFAEAGSGDGWGALGRAFGMSMIEKLKPAAANMAESAIREAVETGRADSVIREASAQEGQVSLASMAEAAAINPKGYQGMTEVNEQGDVATVGFRFHSSVYDTTVTFQVKMEKQDDRWQVTEPYDFGRLLRAISERKDSLLARANRTMQAEADSIMEFGELRRRTSAPCAYCSDDLHVELPVTNTTDQPLSLVSVVLEYGGEPLDDGDFSLISLREIAPGETRTLERSVDYNKFLDWHETLRYGSLTPRADMILIRPPDSPGTRYVGQIEAMSDLERFRERDHGPGVFIRDDSVSGEQDTIGVDGSTLEEALSESS